eukprot:TRINITY_DN26539_c0_g1_i1.p1 TRINITY_DN26539_c0_g1~~TRINITY_DN26539_c0_g1_i1.p1  ORF type:complete len:4103 (+),score=936.60 TRINITY_DN26539_c0_g1_i1:86-12310(+)
MTAIEFAPRGTLLSRRKCLHFRTGGNVFSEKATAVGGRRKFAAQCCTFLRRRRLLWRRFLPSLLLVSLLLCACRVEALPQASFMYGNYVNKDKLFQGKTWELINGNPVFGDEVPYYVPMSMSIAPDGDLIVADTFGERVRKCRGPFCWTVAGGQGRGQSAYQLKSPHGAVLGSEGWLLVSDTFNRRVQRFDARKLNYVGTTAVPSKGTTIIGGADVEGGTRGPQVYGAGILEQAMGLWLDEPKRMLYVVDTGFHRIQRYQLDANYSVVPFSNITVAGVQGEPGEDVYHLNNPTAIYQDNVSDVLYVADARNYRIISFNLTELQYRAEFDDTPNMTGTPVVTNITGRPYGVYYRHEAMYYVDADLCRVMKIYDEEEAIMGGVGGCGPGAKMLKYPAGMHVDFDGTIKVADAYNDRLAIISPAPLPQDVVCDMGRDCEFTLRNLNPTPNMLMAIIKATPGSSCGGKCEMSGIKGPNWQNIMGPEGQLLQNVRHYLGISTVAEPAGAGYGYTICWGPVVTESKVLAGDCSELTTRIGTLSFIPFIYQDTTGLESQCIVGQDCRVNISGYAMPITTIAMTPVVIDASPTSTVCGKSPGENFLGYRDITLNNPATPYDPGKFLYHHQPLRLQDNLTTEMTFFFGAAVTTGRKKLCLCLRGVVDCDKPRLFDFEGGYMLVRGPDLGAVWKCQQTQDCGVNISGYFLKNTDRAMIVEWNDVCGSQQKNFTTLQMTWPSYNFSVDRVQNTSAEDQLVGKASFGLGAPEGQGRYRICYCPTVDLPEVVNTPPSGVACDHFSEYMSEVGQLTVLRVTPGTYHCEVFQNCTIFAAGQLLQETDMIIVAFNLQCGEVAPIAFPDDPYNTFYLGGNAFSAKQGVGADNSQDYAVGPPRIPGHHRICYCATYNSGVKGLGPCTAAEDYFQDAGMVIVRGPTPLAYPCTSMLQCNVTIMGAGFSMNDKLQICAGTSDCGSDTKCTSGGDAAMQGLVSPISISPDGLTADYFLGNVSMGKFTLCYCAAGDGLPGSDTACVAAPSTKLLAGELQVRGVYPDGRFSCAEGAACRVIIPGYKMDNADQIMVAPLDATCGETAPVQRGLFTPWPFMLTATRIVSDGLSTIETKRFDMILAAKAGRYRICYCMVKPCSKYSNNHMDAGVLFVKGLDAPPGGLWNCALFQNCSVQVSGFGLHQSQDGMQIIHPSWGCGGKQVYVTGRDQAANGVENMNGLYYRVEGEIFDGKQFYNNPLSKHKLFFDVYEQRWIFGPRIDPEFPEETGWAYILAPAAAAPNEADPDQQFYAWDPAWPALDKWRPVPQIKVQGSTVPSNTFKETIVNSSNGSAQVRDQVLGAPYLSSQTMHLGQASTLGTYRMCYCVSTDLQDLDTIPCTSETEFMVDFGILEVSSVRGFERFHCPWTFGCNITTVLAESLSYNKVTSLLFTDSKCFEPSVNPDFEGTPYKQTGGTLDQTTQVAFPYGSMPVRGIFEVCVCTSLSGMGDQNVVDCGAIKDHFQNAGKLFVFEMVRIEVGSGASAAFNVSFGKGGAAPGDRVRVFGNDECSGKVEQTFPLQDVAEDGSWAFFVIESGLVPGLYSACYCANFDGDDDGTVACDSDVEFSAKVGQLMITAIEGGIPTSELRGAVQLTIETTDMSATLRDTELVQKLTDTLTQTFADTLNASVDDVIVTITDLRQAAAWRRLQGADAGGDDNATNASDVPVPLNVEVSFEVQLRGSSVQHFSPSCPTLSTASVSSDPNKLIGCMNLQIVLEPSTFLPALETALAVASNSGYQIQPLNSKAFLSSLVTGPKPTDTQCRLGYTCDTSVTGTGSLTDADEILIISAKGVGRDAAIGGVCGPTGQWPGNSVATRRAADAFIANPKTAAPGLGDGFVRNFQLGVPEQSGDYVVCYCWLGGLLSSCVSNSNFFMQGGTITVSGPESNGVNCAIMQTCTFKITGFQLSAFDRVMVLPTWEGKCGVDDPLEDGLEFNKVGTMPTPVAVPYGTEVDGPGSRTYTIGLVTKVGAFRLCYCSAKIGDGPVCQNKADYSMSAGTLAVRGTNWTDANFSCPKSDDFEFPCKLGVKGTALLAQHDSMMARDINGPPCGEFAEMTPVEIVKPNPLLFEPDSMDMVWPPWGNDFSKFHVLQGAVTVTRATTLGDYALCFCAWTEDIGSCSEPQHFPQQVGRMTVRGATGTQIFSCVAGKTCGVKIQGLDLSGADKVRIVGPHEKCSFDASSVVQYNPAPATNVSDNRTEAEYFLGVIEKDPRDLPLSFKICYCADFASDQHYPFGSLNGTDLVRATGAGTRVPCNNASDFTHSAGYINTVVCPEQPENPIFTPPVLDVFGDPGSPEVVLTLMATEDCEGSLAARQTGLMKEDDVRIPLKDLLANETLRINVTSRVSTRLRQCEPGMDINLARMQMLYESYLFVRVVHGGKNLSLRHGFHIELEAHTNDTQGQDVTCAAVRYHVIPFACSQLGATFYGVFLHGVWILAMFWVLVWPMAAPHVFHFFQTNFVVQSFCYPCIVCARPVMRCWKCLYGSGKGEKAVYSIQATAQISGWNYMLSARFTAIIILSLRLGIIACQVYFQGHLRWIEDWWIVIVPACCVGSAIVTQMLIVILAEGRKSLKHLVRLRPIIMSMAAAAKLHFDIMVPIVARNNHSEVWPIIVALWAFVFCTHVVWPTLTLLYSFVTLKKSVSTSSFQEALKLLPEDLRSPAALPTLTEEPKPELFDYQERPKAFNRARLAPRNPIPDDRNTIVQRADEGRTRMIINKCCSFVLLFCGPCRSICNLCWGLQAAKVRWMLFRSCFTRTPPEIRFRHRLATLCGYLMGSHWCIVTTAARSTIEASIGLKLAPAQNRCIVMCLAAGNLDITAFSAYLLVMYGHRMAPPELVVLSVSCFFGVLQFLMGDLLRALCEVVSGLVQTFGGYFVALVACFCRIVISMAMMDQCPVDILMHQLLFCSVFAIEVPLFIFVRSLGEPVNLDLPKTKSSKVVPLNEGSLGSTGGLDLSISPTTAREATKLGTGVTGLGDTIASLFAGDLPLPPLVAELDNFMAVLNEELARNLDKLPRPDEMAEWVPNLRTKSAKEVKIESICRWQNTALSLARDIHHLLSNLGALPTLEEKFATMMKVSDTVDEINFLLSDEQGGVNPIVHELVWKKEEEVENFRLIKRSVDFSRSLVYRTADVRSRGHAVEMLFPDGPGLVLVHWREIETLGCLPAHTQVRKASEIPHKHPVVIAVILDLRGEPNDSEIAHLHARQLVGFAHWYKKRWGRSMEPYFWIADSCLPDPKCSMHDKIHLKTQQDEEVELTDEEQREAALDAQLAMIGRQVSGDSDVLAEGRELWTEGIVGAIAPLAFAAADAVLLCDSERIPYSATARTFMAMAHSLTPGGAVMYEVDQKLVIDEKAGASHYAALDQSLTFSERSSSPNSRALALAGSLTEDRALFTPSATRSGREGKPKSYKMPAIALEDRTPLREGRHLEVQFESEDLEDGELNRTLSGTLKSLGSLGSGLPKTLPDMKLALSLGKMHSQASQQTTQGKSPKSVNPVFGQGMQRLLNDDPRNCCEAMGCCKRRNPIGDFPFAPSRGRRLDRMLIDPTQWEDIRLNPKELEHTNRLYHLLNACYVHPTSQLAIPPILAEPLKLGTSFLHSYRLEPPRKQREKKENPYKKMMSAKRALSALSPVGAAIGLRSPKSPGSGSPKNRLALDNRSDDSGLEPDYDDLSEVTASEEEAPQEYKNTTVEEQALELYYNIRPEPEPVDPVLEQEKERIARLGPHYATEIAEGAPLRKTAHEDLLKGVPDPTEEAKKPQGPPRVGRIMGLPQAPKEVQKITFSTTVRTPLIKVSAAGLTVEQMRDGARDARGQLKPGAVPSGGMAITEQALTRTLSVAPDCKAAARGVCFSVTIEAADDKWHEGLGIGFTGTNPATWSGALPRDATDLPRHFMCGYTGFWVMNGLREKAYLYGSQVDAWKANKLRKGDVVTACLVGKPAEVFRIFVNGRIVAERRTTGTNAPNPSLENLWGVVDLGGACIRLRAGGRGDAQPASFVGRASPDQLKKIALGQSLSPTPPSVNSSPVKGAAATRSGTGLLS